MMKIFNDNSFEELSLFCNQFNNNIFVIIDQNVDSNINKYDIKNSWIVADSKKIVVQSSEKNKSIEEAQKIWQFLIDNNANRNSLIINVGGGIVCDLGGFAAATFKRGCSYINIPTTLLAMIDASVGGKTGINFEGYKNEVGVLCLPKAVFLNTNFLKTSSAAAWFDGYAEMLKYGFIHSHELLNTIFSLDLENVDTELLRELINKSIEIKQQIVEQDFCDYGIRRALNFGHTFAHAFEAFAAQKQTAISHGTAVAWGMVCELYISVLKFEFPKPMLLKLRTFVKENYNFVGICNNNFDTIYQFIRHDKKNSGSSINCTLLREVGEVEVNQIISKGEIFEALDFIA